MSSCARLTVLGAPMGRGCPAVTDR